jgi:hypothetical protein
MLCKICKTNEVGPTVPGRTMRPGTDFCETCFYTGAAAERERADLIARIEALDEVENGSGVQHTGGGCFNLALTLTDGRYLTPSVGYVENGGVWPEPGLPNEGEGERWCVVVSDSVDAWENWDEDRLWVAESLYTSAQLVDAIRDIATGKLVRAEAAV